MSQGELFRAPGAAAPAPPVAEQLPEFPNPAAMKAWIDREWRKMTPFERELYKERFADAKPAEDAKELAPGGAATYAMSKVLRWRARHQEGNKKP